MAENNKKWKAFLAYTIVAVSPIVVINSSAWAQCDSIYVFFIVVAIIFLFKEKYAKSFVFLGISFACKLQAVFILPLFLFVYFVKKKFSILNFSFIPVVMLLSGTPAVILGRNIFDIFKVYWEQSDTYKSMFLKYPSFWALFCEEGKLKHYETLKGAAMLLTVAVLAILMIIWIISKTPLNKTNLTYIAFILSYVCVLFLPAMHERYGYIYEILSIVIVFVNRKTILLMVSLWIISLYSYADFVFNVRTDMRILAVFNCLLFAVYTLVLMKEMYKEKISLK